MGKEYDDNLTLNEYREFLRKVWSEVKRVLVPGGRACINIANLGRKRYIPLHVFIVEDILDLGFLMRGEIIWNKGSSGSPSTAWGSWLSAKNPVRNSIMLLLRFSQWQSLLLFWLLLIIALPSFLLRVIAELMRRFLAGF